MYADHRMVTSVQDRRVAELRQLVARQRAAETTTPEAQPASARRFSPRHLVRRFRPRPA